jgi:hypothetical protein
MADALVTDYEINGLRSLRSVKLSVKHLRRSFALERVIDINDGQDQEIHREPPARGRCKREHQSRAIGAQANVQARGRVSPAWLRSTRPDAEENNARQGFIDHGVFIKLREHLPAYLKGQ